MKLDASTLGIVWARLIALVDEASAALVRAAFSPVVRESHDFSCVVTDVTGALLAQATASIPSFIATLPRTVQHVARAFEGRLQPGDVIITNDPWLGTGHLPDINLVRPLFVGGRLAGFAASVAHATDIGGRASSIQMRDVFEEGLQIPPIHFLRAGRVDETLMAMIRANVRTPDEVAGDLFAALGGLEVIDAGIAKLLAEYGQASLQPFAQELFARSAAAMEKAIAAVPEGEYRVQSVIDAVTPELRFTTTVRFEKGTCRIVFSDVPKQLEGSSINSVRSYTEAYSLYALKCALLPELPNNEGLWRCVGFEVPEGTVLNHSFPASGLMRHYLGHEAASSVMTALAVALPQRATAASGSAPLWSISLTAPPVDGQPGLNQLFFFNGGIGASAQRDGDNALSWPSNVAGLPIELMERFAPVRVLGKRVRRGSGGAGARCGGDGLEVGFEVLAWPAPLTLRFNGGRLRIPASGVFGGSAGATGEFLINGRRVDPYQPHCVQAGDRFSISTPGGGGFGTPRSPSTKDPRGALP